MIKYYTNSFSSISFGGKDQYTVATDGEGRNYSQV